MLPWLFILIAAVSESGWIYSLKFIELKKILALRPALLIADISQGKALIPLALYILFGIGNIYFFSLAMKSIPAPIAFAVWMGMAIVFTNLLDVFVFHQSYNLQQFFFTVLLLVGIAGLRYSTKS